MEQRNKLSTKIAVLSISLMLMSPPAINGALPTIKSQLEISQAQTEILSTLPSLLVIVFILLSSSIANKIGMKKSVIIGLLLIGFGGSLPLFMGHYIMIVISRLILGAGLGMFNSLAISFISLLYQGKTRVSLLGFRNSVESFGQAALTVIAGFLLNIGWQFTFAIYLLAIPLIFVVILFVPEVKTEGDTEQHLKGEMKEEVKGKLPFEVVFICLFAVLLIMNSTAILVRFPSLAVATEGGGENSSYFLAMMPLFGMFGGIFYGRVHQLLGSKTIYLSLFLLVIVNGLIGFAGTNFGILLVGLFLSGVPIAWVIPHAFNHLCKILGIGKQLNFGISLFVVGCNLGGLLAPYGMQLVENISHNQNLAVPFPIFASIHFLVLLLLLGNDFRKKTSSRK